MDMATAYIIGQILAIIITITVAYFILVWPIFKIIRYIKAGMAGNDIYTKWTIFTVVIAIPIWPYAILSGFAEIITYIIASNKKKDTEHQRPSSTHEPSPGSSADYERWKAEREQGGDEDQTSG